MATKEQMLNACDNAMKKQIAKLLTRFYFEADKPLLGDLTLIKYTEIFFKIVNMDKKYCQPQEPPDKIFGYTISQLKKIIDFYKQRGN